ncbi:MAG: PIN domain-containing protein [Alphaproteobacteria bacterium]|nr:PIN domain-containing protein [Alphaproteobacteria bacterium]
MRPISERGYVVDASVIIKWFAEEPLSAAALSLRSTPLHAPDLLLPDCAEILWKKGRRHEMSNEQIDEAADLLQHADIGLHPTQPLIEQILGFARDLGHPTRDCVYLATAWLLELPLVTADIRFVSLVRTASTERTTLPTVLSLAVFAL